MMNRLGENFVRAKIQLLTDRLTSRNGLKTQKQGRQPIDIMANRHDGGIMAVGGGMVADWHDS